MNRRSTALEVGVYFDVDNSIYVARDDQFADALTGALAAAKNGSKIVLVSNDPAKNAEVVKYIQKYNITDITIIGGPLAVSREISAQLSDAVFNR